MRLVAGFPIAGKKLTSEIRVWDNNSGRELLKIAIPHQLSDLAFSPDGNHLAVAMMSSSPLKLLDTVTGNEVLSIPNASDHWFRGLAFSADGKRLASAVVRGIQKDLRYSQLKVWDIADGKPLLELAEVPDLVEVILFSPKGERIAMKFLSGRCTICDAATGKDLVVLENSGPYTPQAFSYDGTCFVGCGAVIKVWDVVTGKVKFVLKGHAGTVLTARFSRDGTRLFSAGMDGTVKLWDVVRSETLPDRKPEPGLMVRCMAANADGSLVALGMSGLPERPGGPPPRPSEIRLLDSAGKERRRFEVRAEHLTDLALTADGLHAAGFNWARSTDGHSEVIVWNMEDGKEEFSLKGPTSTGFPPELIGAVAFSSDGSRLAVAFGAYPFRPNGAVKVCDATNGRELFSIPVGPYSF